MKMTNKYLMFVSAALLLASCDLDKLPEGQYVGGEQKIITIMALLQFIKLWNKVDKICLVQHLVIIGLIAVRIMQTAFILVLKMN